MKYSFVIPCYRSEHTIKKVVDELVLELKKEKIDNYEIVLVNDCSPDNVWYEIKRIASDNKHVSGVCFSRNFGQHAALLAGYARCTGDVIVSLDDDGQTPIDALGSLLDELNKGYDVVYAYYEDIKQSGFRKFGTKFATLMCKIFIDAPKEFKGSSFYAAKRFVIDEMIKYNNAYPYLLGLVLRTTRKIGYVQTPHRKRLAGKSGYSLRSLFSLWLNGFTAFSVKPLEIGAWLGAVLAVGGFAGGLITVINKLCNPDVLIGWSSIICIMLIIGGAILLMLGLIGEYIGRIYICINKAPQYVVCEETKASIATDEMKDLGWKV